MGEPDDGLREVGSAMCAGEEALVLLADGAESPRGNEERRGEQEEAAAQGRLQRKRRRNRWRDYDEMAAVDVPLAAKRRPGGPEKGLRRAGASTGKQARGSGRAEGPSEKRQVEGAHRDSRPSGGPESRPGRRRNRASATAVAWGDDEQLDLEPLAPGSFPGLPLARIKRVMKDSLRDCVLAAPAAENSATVSFARHPGAGAAASAAAGPLGPERASGSSSPPFPASPPQLQEAVPIPNPPDPQSSAPTSAHHGPPAQPSAAGAGRDAPVAAAQSSPAPAHVLPSVSHEAAVLMARATVSRPDPENHNECPWI